jgi:hypothetical protein
MESASQKTALSNSVQAEEQKVKAKRTVSIAKKPLSGKTQQVKSRVNLKVSKRPLSAKKVVKQVSREKIVRDSFTMPVEDYKLLSELKKTCLSKGIEVKKSELLRAGLRSLAQMNLTTLKKQLSELSEIKTGRPPKQ